MTTTLKLSIAAAAAMFALAGVARAQDIHIALDGKDAKTVHAEIIDAAYKVCQLSDAASFNTASQSQCVSDTIEKADGDYRNLAAARVTRVARAQTTAAPLGER